MNSRVLVEFHREDPEKLAGFLVGNSIENVEKALIKATLQRCLGNKTLAAEILSISTRTLSNKLNKYERESTF